MQRGQLIEKLKEAVVGNYQSIVSLTALLESGIYSKKLLDTIIDKCNQNMMMTHTTCIYICLI